MEPAAGFTFQFSPDLNKVSELICATWAKPCWNYDPGLLALHINRPSGDPELNVAQVSDDGRIASFQAYMPFEVEYYGSLYKAVFASFLTVSADFQGKGLGGPQQGMLIEKAIQKGYDLYITMCEVGAASNYAVEKIFGKKNLDVKVVNVLSYLAALRNLVQPILPEKPSGNSRLITDTDLGSIESLVDSIGDNTPLRKRIPVEDYKFLFISRPHCKTFVFEKDGKVAGLVNLLLLEVLESDTESKLNVYFDNISFGDMTEDERKEFLGDIMLALEDDAYHTAFFPNIGYTDAALFKQFRFRMAPRQVNLYIAPLKDGVLPEGIKEVDSFYMDVC